MVHILVMICLLLYVAELVIQVHFFNLLNFKIYFYLFTMTFSCERLINSICWFKMGSFMGVILSLL